MGGLSMLDIWYFCACVQSLPSVVAPYLMATSLLRSPHASHELREIACTELLKAEPILRYRALPEVLQAGLSSSTVEPGLTGAARRVLVDALETVADGVARGLVAAFDALVLDTPPDDTLDALNDALRRARSIRQSKPGEPVAYVHLEEYVVEVAALSLCLAAARRSDRLAEGLGADSEVGLLIDHALEEDLGRLCLVLGAELACLVGDTVDDRPGIVDKVMRSCSHKGWWEPDLLRAAARLRFLDPSRLRAHQHAEIMGEVVTFAWLGAYDRRRVSVVGQVGDRLERLGLGDVDPELALVMLWQATLWQLATEIDAPATADALEGHWIPQYGEIGGVLRTQVPLAGPALQAWKRRIQLLAGIRMPAERTPELSVRTGEIRTNSWLSLVALSPWVTKEKRTRGRPYRPYRRADGGAPLWRLLAAATCAIEILQHAELTNHEPILGLALHAWEVLETTNRQGLLNLNEGIPLAEVLMQLPEDHAARSLPVQTWGLSLFVWRRLKQIGAGESDVVDPGLIADYLLETDLTPAEQRLRAGMRDRCTDWVHDGLSGSVPGADLRGQGRWRQGAGPDGPSAAERVLSAVAISEVPSRSVKDKAKGLLAVHFAVARPETVVDLAGAEKALNPWSVYASSPLPLAGWSDGALDARIRAAFSRPDETRLGLALITARMASILRADPAERALQAEAMLGWRDAVGRVTSKQDLSRPQRLAMLGLLRLASGGMPEEIALLEELVDTELEFGLGTPLDRWTLFACLGRDCALPSGTATALRERMLGGVYAWRTRPARSTSLRDPVMVARARRADALLDRLLVQFLWEARSIDAGFARELTSALWRQAASRPTLREFGVDLGQTGAPAPWTDLDRRLWVGAAVDPVEDRLRVHAPPRPSLSRTRGDDTVMDGWTFRTAVDLRTRLDERSAAGAESRLLGVVAARQGTDIWVNVGLAEPVAGSLPEHVNDHDPQVGDVVLAVLRSGDRPRTLLAEVRPYPRVEPIPGEVRDAILEIDHREEVPQVSVTVHGESGGSFSLDEQPERIRQVWLPDIVGLLTGELRPAGRDVVSVRTTARREGGHWVPADEGAPELFARLAEDGGQDVRLVLASPVDAERSRYSTAPGCNVVLPHSVWTPQSLGHLTDAVQQLQPNGAGLVIRARVVTGAAEDDARGQPHLELLAGEASLDRRAYDWRHVFEEGSDFEAYRQHEGERFRFDSGVRGFPTIVVSPDHATGTACRFSPGAWGDSEQRRAAVTGVAGTRRLLLRTASRRTFEQIHGVDVGDVLVLARVLSSSAPRDGRLLGWTRQNLSVNVEVESLDFAGPDRLLPSSAVSGRRCVVTSVRPLRFGPAEQYVPLPDDVLLAAVSSRDNKRAVEDHLLRQRTLKGIVVEAPDDARQPDSLFGVWLDLGTTVVPVSLRRANFQHPPQRVGEPVTAQRARHDAWVFSACPRVIRVRPLWAVEERTGTPTPGARFLDEVQWRGRRHVLTQPLTPAGVKAKPMLHLHPLKEGQNPPSDHLAVMAAARSSGRQKGTWEEPRHDLRSGTVELYRDLSRNGGRRAGVRVDTPDGRSLLFTGEVPTASWDTAVTVDHVRMSLFPVSADEFEVNRVFVTSRQQRRGAATVTLASSADADAEDVASGWRGYLRDGRPPVEAEFLPGRVRLLTNWKIPTEQGWSNQVPLEPEEEPWVDRAYATDRIRVVLIGTDGEVRASYRRVPALQLGEAMAVLGQQGVVLGARSVPQHAMYYVDRRTLPPSPWSSSAWSAGAGTEGQTRAQDAGKNVVHRFEWGYGWTLQIPETHLTIAGRPAGKWPVVPFHGDRVREFRVAKDNDGRYRLDIDTAALQWGWHRHIYNDADKGVVFVAELEPTYDGRGARRGARIGAVHVRWRREPGGTRGYRDDQRVPLRRLRLSDDAQTFVEDVWSSEDRRTESVRQGGGGRRERNGSKEESRPEDGVPRRAWVRLRRKTFLETGGATAEFDIVRPVLGARDGLKKDNYVFLEADKIEELDNDLQLLLRPGALLGQTGRQFVVKVRRREYSSRQDLLRQIYYGDGSQRHESALRGNVYLVRIRDIHSSGKWAGGQIRDGLARSVSALRGHLLTSDSATFAMAHRIGNELSLELRPNVRFRLSAEDLADGVDLVAGSVVRLSSEPSATTGHGRIRVTAALRGDSAFVPSDGRPVVLLPRQDLLDRRFDLAAALEQGHYSVAGLPALSLAASLTGADQGPDGRRFSESLITTPHPKVALLTPRASEADTGSRPATTGRLPGQTPRTPGRGPGWSIVSPDATVRVGTVHVESDGKLTARALDGSPYRLPWAQLSFHDGSVQALREHLERGHWQYHDLSTSHRSPEPPHAPVDTAQTLPRKARATGEPVFFSDGWVLRHRENQLARFGFPAGGLLERRTARGQARYTVAVAGLSRLPNGTAVGVWVEVAPGHLVELLGSMLTTADARQVPLTGVDWTHLAPGDLITVLVRRGHELEIGSIALQAWTPGPRGAFAYRALLPVAALDYDAGAMTLGTGEWTLTVPIEPDQPAVPSGGFAWLTRSGQVTPVVPADDSAPTGEAEPAAALVPRADPASPVDSGDVVALNVDGQSQRGLFLRPDDVVLLTQGDGGLQILGVPRLRPVLDNTPQHWAPWLRGMLADEPGTLLGLCGGALPVTVQTVDAATIVVSRKRQRDEALKRGESVPVVPLGVAREAFVLRAGHRLYICAVREVVPGLPYQHAEAAAGLLRRVPELLWLTRNQNGWTIGLPDERATGDGVEIRVRLLGRLGDDASAGVLCWDFAGRRPRWLPSTTIGWTAPRPEQLDVWVREGEPDEPDSVQPVGTVERAGTVSEGPLPRLRELSVALRKDGTVSLTGTKANLQRLARLRVGDPLCVQLLQHHGTPVDGRVEFLARVHLSEVLVPARLGLKAQVEVLAPRFCEVELRRVGVGRDGDRAEVRVSDIGRRVLAMAVPSGFAGQQPVPARLDELDTALVDAAVRVSADVLVSNELSRVLISWLADRGEQVLGPSADLPLPLAPALAAVSLLARLGAHSTSGESRGLTAAAQEAAVHACRQLGLRAAVSRHLEPLVNLWSAPGVAANERGRLWSRLSKVTLACTTTERDVEQMLDLHDGLLRRGAAREDRDLLRVMSAVVTSVGAHFDYGVIHDYPGLGRRINALGRAVAPRRKALVSQPALIPAQRVFVDELLKDAVRAFRMTLLPLPPVLQDEGCLLHAAGLRSRLLTQLRRRLDEEETVGSRGL